ncbi:MAG TPA: DUF4065 domain-containing protein [Melioribacteraceae bacterium]|nr:DUF4065 domain-containing protein [Melioribacteraceae bacterium]
MESINLAYYILDRFSTEKITPLKLQKLIYYVKSWSIIAKIDLGDIRFYKWDFGPVNKEVYNNFKSYGKSVIKVTKNDIQDIKIFSNRDFIDFIILNYIYFDAFTLSAMTHQEDPWSKTIDNQLIDERLIKEYYSKKDFARNFPYKKDNPFYPLKTNLDYSFELDFAKEDKISGRVFSSFNEYLRIMHDEQELYKNTLLQAFNNSFIEMSSNIFEEK